MEEPEWVNITFEMLIEVPRIKKGCEVFLNATATVKHEEPFSVQPDTNIKKFINDIMFARNVDPIDVRILKVELVS